MESENNYCSFVEEGNLYSFQHDYSRAIFAYSSALAANPPQSVKGVIYSNRAFCYTKLAMFPEARADIQMSIEIDPLSQYTNTISDIFDTTYIHQTVLPTKPQRSFASIPCSATLDCLTSCSEKIDENEENKKQFYTKRADAFALSGFYKRAISDYVNARKYTNDVSNLPTLAYYAVLAHQNAFADEILRVCADCKIEAPLAKGLLSLLNFRYKEAFDYFNEATKYQESEPYKYLTFIHYAMGNVSKAYNNSRKYFGQDNYFFFLQTCLRIITCNDLPACTK